MNSQATRNFNPAVLAAFLTAAAAGQVHAGEGDLKAAPGSTEAFIQAAKVAEQRVKKVKAESKKQLAELHAKRAAELEARKKTPRYILGSQIAKEIDGKKGTELKAVLIKRAKQAAASKTTMDDKLVADIAHRRSSTGFYRRKHKFSKADTADVLKLLPNVQIKGNEAVVISKAESGKARKEDTKVSKADTKKKTGEALAMVRNETVAPKIKAPQRTPGENTKANKR